MNDEFAISFPCNYDEEIGVAEALKSTGVQFSVSSDVMEGIDTQEIIALSLPATYVLVAALKLLSPVLVEVIKSRKIIVKVGDSCIAQVQAESLVPKSTSDSLPAAT